MSKELKAVIFDLDGTLLDTLVDLADSCNHAMEAFGYPQRTMEEVRSFVGNGYARLIELALPQGKENAVFEKAVDEGKSFYSVHCNDNTKPYEGIPEILEILTSLDIKVGIVSNKPDPQVKELARQYFDGYVNDETAVGERPGILRKPSPDALFEIMKILDVKPENVVYVGDSDVDIFTAKNAGVECYSCTWGFRDKDFLISNGATHIITSPEELLLLV